MNRITIVGNLTKAPEIRTTSNGKAVCHMVIASDRGRKSENTDFLEVEAWGDLAETASTLTKGAFVRVSGSLRTGSYESSDGSKRKTFVVNATKIERYQRSSEVAA